MVPEKHRQRVYAVTMNRKLKPKSGSSPYMLTNKLSMYHRQPKCTHSPQSRQSTSLGGGRAFLQNF